MIAPDIEIVATKDFNMKEFENDLETKISFSKLRDGKSLLHCTVITGGSNRLFEDSQGKSQMFVTHSRWDLMI